MKIKISVIILLAFLSVSTVAQTPDSVVNKSVTVTREFQPVITDVGKVISEPKVVEPVVDKSRPVYSDITTPLSIDYSIHTLPATELLHTAAAAKKGFLRLGVGVPLNTLADFMYPVLNDGRNRLDVAVHHLGAFVDKKHTKTAASIKYDHLFKSFDLYGAIGGSHDYFNYYGIPFAGTETFNMADVVNSYGNATYLSKEGSSFSLREISGLPLDNTHWRAHATAGARSLPLADNLIFDAQVNYKLFNSVNGGFSENQLHLNGLFEVPFEFNRLGIDIDIFDFSYAGGLDPQFSFPTNYNLFKLNPYLKLVGTDWFLKLGAKTGISFGGAGQIFTPSADVSGQWNALPEYLSVYGGVTGDLTVNSLYDTYNENRYLSPQNRIKDTYTPVDAYVGVKISPVYHLLIDVYGQHKIISNQYFYVNREFERTTTEADMPENFSRIYLNRFDVVFSQANRTSVGTRTSWDYKNQINIYLKGAYHLWDVKDEIKAWHLPSWDADFGANVKVGSDISVNTQFIFQDGRYAKLSHGQGTKMEPVFDWNIGAAYAYRDWMSVFFRVNNILNKKYEFYQGYEVQGINGMIGAAFSF